MDEIIKMTWHCVAVVVTLFILGTAVTWLTREDDDFLDYAPAEMTVAECMEIKTNLEARGYTRIQIYESTIPRTSDRVTVIRAKAKQSK